MTSDGEPLDVLVSAGALLIPGVEFCHIALRPKKAGVPDLILHLI